MSAKPKERLYKLADGGGLALWVYPNGRKFWRFEYRRTDKKLDTITIGSYPEITLSDARLRRAEYRSQLAKGVDPKAQQRVEPTFGEVAALWLERMKPEVTPNYYEKLINALRKNVPPKFSSMVMSEIKPPDVVKILTVIEKRGALEQLNRVRQNLKVIWEFAISRGICELNPVASIGMNAFKKHRSTHYQALAPHQIPLLLEKLDMGPCTEITRLCLYFQLYSLSRPSEATNALKSEINFETQQWVLSAEKMKKRKDHIVPLSNQMMALISELVALDLPGPYLFPGQSGKNTSLCSETLRAALRRMELPTTAHGFRALGSTALNESGLFRSDVIERALSHVERNKTRAAYNRAEYIEERTVMLQWWADFLDSHRS